MIEGHVGTADFKQTIVLVLFARFHYIIQRVFGRTVAGYRDSGIAPQS